MKDSSGYSTLQFIVSLFIVCIFFGTLSICIKSFSFEILKQRQILSEEKSINETFKSIMNELKGDNTPASDSSHDKIWKWNDSSSDGLTVKIDSLSGKININSFPKDILTKTELRNLFTDSSSSVQKIYESESLFCRMDSLSDYIPQENYEKFFTTYGWYNYNSADANRLELFLKSMNLNPSGYLSKRKNLLTNRQYLQTYTELKFNSGVLYNSLFPYVNLEAPMNVNFIDENVLKDILTYSPMKVSNGYSKTNSIISARQSQEITDEKLRNILGLKSNHLIYSLLGTKTYFYQIDIEGKYRKCRYVVSREITDIKTNNNKTGWFLMEKSWI